MDWDTKTILDATYVIICTTQQKKLKKIKFYKIEKITIKKNLIRMTNQKKNLLVHFIFCLFVLSRIGRQSL